MKSKKSAVKSMRFSRTGFNSENLHIFFYLLIPVILLAPPISRWILKIVPVHLYFFGLSFFISYSLIPVFHKLGLILDILDVPGGRKAHESSTPLLGGAAIFIAFLVLLNFYSGQKAEFRAFFYAATLIAFIGMVDDIYPLPSWLKLIGQLVATTIMIVHGIRISLLPQHPVFNFLEYLITAIWIIGITNAINFLDGLDGLASGVSAIIAFFFFAIAYSVNDIPMAVISITLCGGILAFIPYNLRLRKSALIFLGDAGSTFLGFTLASLGIYGTWGSDKYIDFLIPVLLLGVPIADVTLTTVVRIYSGKVKSIREWLEYTGRDHFHHRLLSLGLGKKTAVAVIWLITSVMGCTALLIMRGDIKVALIALIQGLLLFSVLIIMMVFGKNREVRID